MSIRLETFHPSPTVNNINGPENDKKKELAKKNIFRPTIASLIISLSSFVIGMSLGYPATAIPNLNSKHGPFKVDQFQYSWVGSLHFLGSVPGALMSGWTMDRLGRKTTVMIGTFPYVVGWVLITGSINIEMMYAGRTLVGFCSALILPIVGVYISEISPPKIRGILMSFHELGLNIGALLMYILGAFLDWNWTSVICAVILTVMMCGMFWMPETPRWLIMNNERELALETLEWLRGAGVNCAQEICDIEESIKDTKEMTPWPQYFKSPLLKSLIVSQFLFILQELSGINVVRQYTVTIFKDANTNLNPNIETIIVGLVLVAGSVMFTLIVEKRGRRVFLLLSSMTMALSLAGMGAYIEVKNAYPLFAKSNLFWLPLLTLATTCIGYVFGVGPMPYVITSEIFPNRARGRASSIGVATLCFFGFIITKYFVNLSYAIGQAGAFFMCGGVCAIGFVLAYFIVPETMGKKLEYIESELISENNIKL